MSNVVGEESLAFLTGEPRRPFSPPAPAINAVLPDKLQHLIQLSMSHLLFPVAPPAAGWPFLNTISDLPAARLEDILST